MIKIYDGYFADPDGFIVSTKTNKEKRLTGQNNIHGYPMVCIQINGVQKNLSVHRLIAMAFIPNPNNLPCVNHINGIKTDNRVENLEWVTRSENTKHAYKIGLMRADLDNSRVKKISVIQAKVIREAINKGFKQKDIARYFNISAGNITHVKQNKTWAI